MNRTEEAGRAAGRAFRQAVVDRLRFLGGGSLPPGVGPGVSDGSSDRSGGIYSRSGRGRARRGGGSIGPGGDIDAPAYGGGKASSNVESWMRFAMAPRDSGGLGLSREQAAGKVGNLVNESGHGIDPWGRPGDKGTAHGSAQWREARFERLKSKSAEWGLDYKTTGAQQRFMRWEYDNTHRGAYAALRGAKTPEEAATIVNRRYEISADRSGVRERDARRYFNSDVARGPAPGLNTAPSWQSIPSSPRSPLAGPAPAIEGSGTRGPVEMANRGATRNRPITPDLSNKLQEAIGAVYGPGYRAEVYSGGQPAKGTRGARVGSTRHDLGNAGDLYVVGPNGKRVTSDAELAKLGQYWAAKRYGGVGMTMRGGGIHLDTHAGRSPFWTYGAISPAARRAMRAGLSGQMPTLAPTPAKPADVAIDKVAPVEAYRGFLGSATNRDGKYTNPAAKPAPKPAASNAEPLKPPT